MQKQQQQQQQKQQQNIVKQNIKQKQICQYYVERKKRQCKFNAIIGSKYCSAHCSDLQNKIQCPYQKDFYISKDKYQKHLKNCPKLISKQKQQQNKWYCKDINLFNNQKQEIHSIQISNLSQINDSIIDKIYKKIIQMYVQYYQKERRIIFISSRQKQNLQNITNDHLQAKLITQKAFQNKLIHPQLIYVQFGAGKGILSYSIAIKIQQQFKTYSKNILLQRQSRRNKFDKFFRDNPYFQRYKGDVSNFDFKQLPSTMATTAIQKCRLIRQHEQIQKQISKYELIGICKHMCGQALDISVRGLLQGNAKGCILASCCHHLCRYHTYLNPSFFQKEGLSPEQIQILFRISSWGTRSYYFQKIQQNIFQQLSNKNYLQLTPQQKILIGRMCKRLIDAGRAQYLQGKIYQYCSDQLTPQNYVIISRN